MKKVIICILLTLVIVVVGQRQIFASLVDAAAGWLTAPAATPAEAALPTFSEQLGTGGASDLLDVTLYFRYADTGLLGAQPAQLDIRREETIATSIVQRLIVGPEMSSARLEGVFPQGTRLISVTGEGNTAFVTLSRDFLGRPDGAPADWEDLAVWQEEAALRRMLAVQSLVLSLTEDGRYQRVQLYLADNNDEIPERVPLAYFSTDVTDPGVVLAACSRDESFLLTPQRALNRLLDRWQKKDWAALYDMLSSGEGEELPTLTAFETQMRSIDMSLVHYETTAGTVSYNGQRATLVLSALLRSPEGGDVSLSRESIPLVREAGNWTMEYETLQSLMIRD